MLTTLGHEGVPLRRENLHPNALLRDCQRWLRCSKDEELPKGVDEWHCLERRLRLSERIEITRQKRPDVSQISWADYTDPATDFHETFEPQPPTVTALVAVAVLCRE